MFVTEYDISCLIIQKKWLSLREHLKKCNPNSGLQFIHKESDNSMSTAKLICIPAF